MVGAYGWVVGPEKPVEMILGGVKKMNKRVIV